MNSTQIKKQIAQLQEQLKEAEIEESAIIPDDEFMTNTDESDVYEDEWLPSDELTEDDLNEDRQYDENTVGAFIDVLRRNCKMEDVLMPRLNPGKKELFVFDVYSKAGRAVIDFVSGRVDDPMTI